MNTIHTLQHLPHTLTQAMAELKSYWMFPISNKIVLFCALISLLLLVVKWNSLPMLVPIWYSRPWGNEQLAWKGVLLILPIGSICIHLCNCLIAKVLLQNEKIFIQILFITSLLISLLSFISVFNIVFLVT